VMVESSSTIKILGFITGAFLASGLSLEQGPFRAENRRISVCVSTAVNTRGREASTIVD
jgi:hypothetical protein